jgi:hypothetical protein
MNNCKCPDWQKVVHEHQQLFQKHPAYGWILSWLEITDEGSHHKTHQYGIKIVFCPFCGNQINEAS